MALINMTRHLAPGGRLVLTTPNATSIGAFLRVLCRRATNVYWDHVALYTPEHIQAICDRHGYELEETAFFTLPDQRTLVLRVKSAFITLFGHIWPRFHASLLCVISVAHPDA